MQDGDLTPNLFTPFGFGRANQTRARRETFSIVNVRAGFQSDTWGAHIFVRNLLDKETLQEIIPAPEFGGSFIHPGARRQWGAEVTYEF